MVCGKRHHIAILKRNVTPNPGLYSRIPNWRSVMLGIRWARILVGGFLAELAVFAVFALPESQAPASRPVVSQAQYDAWQKELSNWGRWGPDDQLGTLNLITPATAARRWRWSRKACRYRSRPILFSKRRRTSRARPNGRC